MLLESIETSERGALIKVSLTENRDIDTIHGKDLLGTFIVRCPLKSGLDLITRIHKGHVPENDDFESNDLHVEYITLVAEAEYSYLFDEFLVVFDEINYNIAEAQGLVRTEDVIEIMKNVILKMS